MTVTANFRASRWNPRTWPIDPRVFLGGLPLFAFIAGHHLGNAYIAIVAGLLASVFVYLVGNRRGALGLLALFFFFTTLIWAVAGLIMGDERAYLTQEGMRDFVSAGMAVVTVLIRRPLFALVIRELVPSLERLLPLTHPVFLWTTLLWAAVNAVQGVVRLMMLNSDLGVGEYLFWSRAFAWPTTLLMYAIILVIMWRVVINERKKAAPAEHERREQHLAA